MQPDIPLNYAALNAAYHFLNLLIVFMILAHWQ